MSQDQASDAKPEAVSSPNDATKVEEPSGFDSADLPEEKSEEPDPMRENYLRALADMANLRKRTIAQVRSAGDNERRAVLGAFLEVLDSLGHALEAHEGEHNDWVEGTQNIQRQTLRIFEKFGVKPLEAEGAEFDPNLHEAVSRLADAEKPEGTVIAVVQMGYRFSDGTLLRPARVVVSYRQ